MGRHELMSLLMPEDHRHRCLMSSPRGFFQLPGELRTRLEIHASQIAGKTAVKQWKNVNFETSIDEIWNPLAQQHVRNLTTPSSKEPSWQQIHYNTVIIEQCIRSASPQLRASTDAVMYSSATSIGRPPTCRSRWWGSILTTVIVQHTPTPSACNQPAYRRIPPMRPMTPRAFTRAWPRLCARWNGATTPGSSGPFPFAHWGLWAPSLLCATHAVSRVPL